MEENREKLLIEFYDLLEKKRCHAAIDLLFEKTDVFFSEGMFSEVDGILELLNVERLDENIMASLLAITLPAREHLKCRVKFFENVRKILNKKIPDRTEKILRGLE